MKRWMGVLLLLVGGLGAESVRPGPCQLLADTRMLRPRDRRGNPDRNDRDRRADREPHNDRDRVDDRERRRRDF